MTDDPWHELNHILAGFGLDDPPLLARIRQVARLQEVERDQPIIQAGQRPTHFFAILSGLARYYYLSPEGKEWNKAFFHEGQLIGSLSAYLKRQPCTYSIAAVEPCRLVTIPLDLFDSAGAGHPQLESLLAQYTRLIMLRNEDREALLLTCNSEERYRWLLRHEAWLLDRVPQYHLASYLSMDAVSFSRIKRKLAG
ncbi:Cyclic nucleotide-binding domain protein [compost metagenome]